MSRSWTTVAALLFSASLLGCPAPAPVLELTLEGPGEAELEVGEVHRLELVLENAAPDAAMITEIVLAGEGEAFTLASRPSVPVAVAPGDAIELGVLFEVVEAGVWSERLVVEAGPVATAVGSPLGAPVRPELGLRRLSFALEVGAFSVVVDEDGDGVSPPEDCDDQDPSVYPGAKEECDGIDNDCDGEVDEGLTALFLPDLDGDGAPGPGEPFEGCIEPPPANAALADADTDCDDTDPAIAPGLEEICDERDNDCDGDVDEDLDALYWQDRDGDGVGRGATARHCIDTQPEGWVLVEEEDCDDTAPHVFPGAEELCDGLDGDCDGSVPGEELDLDADGWSPCGGDCAEADPERYPGAVEVCGGADEDCDGLLGPDERDGDGDGISVCDGDCDDTDPSRAPGLAELCDGRDNSCSGAVPGEELDVDGDGAAPCAGDCNDGDPAIGPRASELCDGLDTDCDGVVPTDEADLDGDGFALCAGDCDDSDPSTAPGADEVCDGRDNDCDGVLFPSEADADADGVVACLGDCDDGDPLVRPGAVERCNGADDDCDGAVPADEQDADGDGESACAGDCDDSDALSWSGAAERCDGLDNDCDALIDEASDLLDGPLWVHAEHPLGTAAQLVGYREANGWLPETIAVIGSGTVQEWTGAVVGPPGGAGIPEVLAIRQNLDNARLLRFTAECDAGTPAWSSAQLAVVGVDARELLSADVDGDGWEDLVWREGNLLWWARGVGPERALAPPVSFGLALGDREHLALVARAEDADGDGRDDVLVCGWNATDLSTSCELWLGDELLGLRPADGASAHLSLFTLPASGPLLTLGVTWIDLDGDAAPDLVFGASDRGDRGQLWTASWDGGWPTATPWLDWSEVSPDGTGLGWLQAGEGAEGGQSLFTARLLDDATLALEAWPLLGSGLLGPVQPVELGVPRSAAAGGLTPEVLAQPR